MPRFTEASLVKELEENGIGRPSTYATILSTIQDRDYVKKEERRFQPTELGVLVNELDFDPDESFEVGIGVAVTIANGWLTVGIGRNISTFDPFTAEQDSGGVR